MDQDTPTPSNTTTPGQTPPPPKANRTGLIVGIIIGAVLLLGIGIWAVTQMSRTSDQAATDRTKDTSHETVEISSLNSLSLEAPESLPGYSLAQSNETQAQYVNESGDCKLIFGTAGAESVPGTDSKDMATRLLDANQQQGGTVIQPLKEGEPLHLMAKDGKVAYSIPTFEFGLETAQGSALVHYSAAILKNNDRVVITRSCGEQSKLTELDQLAAKLIVTPKE